jgi:hypothetical protein
MTAAIAIVQATSDHYFSLNMAISHCVFRIAFDFGAYFPMVE